MGICGSSNKVVFKVCEAARIGDLTDEIAPFCDEVDVNYRGADGRNALGTVAKYGRLELFKRIMEGKNGHKVTKETLGHTLMQCCKGETRLQIAKFLLDKGAEVDYVDGYQETPLIACARKSAGINDADPKSIKHRRKVAMLLMSRGADVTFKNIDGYNALTMACQELNEKFALMVVKKGADLMIIQDWIKEDKKRSKNWVACSVLATYAFAHPKFKEQMKNQFMQRFDPDGSGDLDKSELLTFVAYNFKMAFNAGLKPTTKFHDDGTLEIEQIKQLIKERCKDVLNQYRSMDTSRDGKFSWDELEPVIRDFYVNMWSQNRPNDIPQEPEDDDDDDADFAIENTKLDKKQEKAGVKPTQGMAGALPPDWKATKDQNGKVYYYNTKTNATQWERPT